MSEVCAASQIVLTRSGNKCKRLNDPNRMPIVFDAPQLPECVPYMLEQRSNTRRVAPSTNPCLPKKVSMRSRLCVMSINVQIQKRPPLAVHPEALDAQRRCLNQFIVWNALFFSSLEEILALNHKQCPLSESPAGIFSRSQFIRSGLHRMDLRFNSPVDL